jgi:replicative DNA helicase
MRAKAEHGPLGLVVVDYLQLMGHRGKFENRNQEVSALSRGFKILGKELDVPMLVLSQLSRAVEQRAGDHRPILSDLRESGGIEQDADLVGFVFREEMYHRDREDLRGLAELIVAKQRCGPIGTVNLVYLHAQTKFENRAEDLPIEEDTARYPN